MLRMKHRDDVQHIVISTVMFIVCDGESVKFLSAFPLLIPDGQRLTEKGGLYCNER